MDVDADAKPGERGGASQGASERREQRGDEGGVRRTGAHRARQRGAVGLHESTHEGSGGAQTLALRRCAGRRSRGAHESRCVERSASLHQRLMLDDDNVMDRERYCSL